MFIVYEAVKNTPYGKCYVPPEPHLVTASDIYRRRKLTFTTIFLLLLPNQLFNMEKRLRD